MIIPFTVSRPVIGIVGGVGPFAGLDLNRKIFDNTLTDGTDQDHLEVILYSTGSLVTDRTDWLLYGMSESPAMGLYEALRALSEAGATVAAIACNTAHSIRIMQPLRMMLEQGEVEIELLDMITETGRFIREQFATKHGEPVRVGLLATRGTLETGVYDRLEFESPGGIKVVRPDHNVAAAVHGAIYNRQWGIKARSLPVTGQARGECLRAAEHLTGKELQGMILGCTELPLALAESEISGVRLIDPGQIMARALIAHVAPDKLKPLGEL
ncbi:MAG: aspartate/glutamate racemase family protein [Candidatus Glassbacteria bacterium]|nr:aspartate/glutamate racemase family protein [Candidatus Glassbacteria bacterium]